MPRAATFRSFSSSLPQCVLSPPLSLHPLLTVPLPFSALSRTKLSPPLPSVSPQRGSRIAPLPPFSDKSTAIFLHPVVLCIARTSFVLMYVQLSVHVFPSLPSSPRSVASLGTVYRDRRALRSGGKRKTFIIVAARDGLSVAGGISKRIIRPAIICVLRLPVADLLGAWHAIRRCSDHGKSDIGTKGRA